MRRSIFKRFFGPVSLLIVGAISFAACLSPDALAESSDAPNGIASQFADKLAPEEKAWLKAHPEISMGIMDAWPPMNYVDFNGVSHGIGVDYIRAINERLGGSIRLVPGPFKDNLAKVKAKTLDSLMDVTPKPEREEFLNFTRQYLNIPHVIVAPNDGPYFAAEKDLVGYTLALESGFYNIRYFRNKYPSITIKEYPDTAQALGAVSRGEADAYVGNRAVAAWIMEQELISNLQFEARAEKPGSVLTIGVRKDWPLFASILDKALADMTVDEVHAIHRFWTGIVPDAAKTTEALITPEEQAWLAEHPIIKIGIGESWAPFVFKRRGGDLAGYDVDFLGMINKLTGAHIQLVAGQWKDIVGQAQRQEIDGLAESGVVESRREHFLFTDPYNRVEYAAATMPEKAKIRSLFDLKGKRIAHLKGNVWTKKIIKSIGDVKIIEAMSEKEAFGFVVEGKADFALVPIFQYSALRDIYHQSFVFAHVFSDDEFALKAGYSIRKDWPELVSILNKAMAAIDAGERYALFEKWVPIKDASEESASSIGKSFDVAKFLFWSLGVVFVGMAVVIFIGWLVKGRPKHLSIRDSLFLISFIYGALITAGAAFVILLADAHDREDMAYRRNIESLNLAWELKQSSDDLTRLARTYAVTGDPIYEEYFRRIKDIRDGKRPHPKNFSPFYWDYVTADMTQLDQDGETYSLEGRMENLGLTEKELAKLSEAKKESDALIALENIAMNAVKGLYRDKDGRFTVAGDADRAMARDLLHGEEYHQAKARIMKPIEQFQKLLNTRIADELAMVDQRNKATALVVTIVVAATIIFSIYVFFLMRRRIVRPLSMLEAGAMHIKRGDYSHRIDATSNDEIGSLAAAFNAMSLSIKENTSRLHAVIESVADGVLVVDRKKRITAYNRRFLELWNVDPELAKNGDDTVLLKSVLDQLENPGSFLDRVEYLYANLEKEDFSRLLLVDDRIFERVTPRRNGLAIRSSGESGAFGTSRSVVGPNRHLRRARRACGRSSTIFPARSSSRIATADISWSTVFSSRAPAFPRARHLAVRISRSFHRMSDDSS